MEHGPRWPGSEHKNNLNQMLENIYINYVIAASLNNEVHDLGHTHIAEVITKWLHQLHKHPVKHNLKSVHGC